MKKLLFSLLILSLLSVVAAGCADSNTGNGGTPVLDNSGDVTPDIPDGSGTPDAGKTPGSQDNPGPINPGNISELSGTKQGFPFEAYGQDVYVCMEAQPLLDAFPEPNDIFESPSCAFAGIDITYFYPGFELTTYPDDDTEYILSVVFNDDSITTPEGIYLGCTPGMVINAYGNAFAEDGNRYIYTEGAASLIFTFEDGIAIGIVYTLNIPE